MFWSRTSYKPPPQGWTTRSLTDWDCSKFSCHATPLVAWVLEGEVDVPRLSRTFVAAIKRRAPWVAGRLARTQTGTPPYELHVPPPDNNDIEAFSQTVFEEPETLLHDIIPYTRAGHATPVIHSSGTLDVNSLNPLNNMPGGVEGYIEGNVPPIHLHVIKAKDATLVSVSWSHVVMDALGFGQIVEVWEQLLKSEGQDSQIDPPPPQPEDTYAFTKNVDLDPAWVPPQWFKPGILDFLKLGLRTVMDMYNYPVSQGSLYIPKPIVDRWMDEASKELPEGRWVSRNDLVTAWVYKYAYGSFPDVSTNILVTALNLRGRHPSLPRTIIGNTPTAYIAPPLTSLQLRTMPLARIALALRAALDQFSDPAFVAQVATYEVRRLRAGTTMLPFGSASNRFCILSTWSKQGLTAPYFGAGTKTVCCIPYNAQGNYPGLCTTMDDPEGGWTLSAKLKKAAWEDMKPQLAKEAVDAGIATKG